MRSPSSSKTKRQNIRQNRKRLESNNVLRLKSARSYSPRPMKIPGPWEAELSYGVQHLPSAFQISILLDELIEELIKAMRDVIVQLSVSNKRPETVPGSDKPYPCYKDRESNFMRVGSERVNNVKKFRNEDNKECLNSHKPDANFAHTKIVTAAHVVYDELEGTNTTCHLFFDIRMKEEIVIIVSHPHGCSKQVSVGYHNYHYNFNYNNKFGHLYTTATCPGSSGAQIWSVFLLYQRISFNVFSSQWELEKITKFFHRWPESHVMGQPVPLEIECLGSNFSDVSKVVREEEELKATSHTLNLVINEVEAVKSMIATMVVLDNEKVKNLNDDKFSKSENKSGDDENHISLLDQLLSQPYFRIKTQDYEVRIIQGQQHPVAIRDIPWNWLREELWRLHTFSLYPHSAKKSAILLAQAGFAYYGSGKGSDDSVICYFCCATKQGWLNSDIISEIHRILSPYCCMVTGENCNNIPITEPPQGNALFSTLSNSYDLIANASFEPQVGKDNNEDEIECDNPHDNRQAQGRPNLSRTPFESDRNAETTQTAKPFKMANQTVLCSGTVNSSTALPTAAQNQPVSSTTSYNPLASNSNQHNQTSPSVSSYIIQTSIDPQETVNIAASVNTSSVFSPAQTLNGHQVTVQTVNQSASTVNQSNQSASTINQSNQSASTVDQSNHSASTTASNTTPINQTTNSSQENSSQVALGNTQVTKNPTYGELGIITERPKRFEFAVRATRYASFDPWPRDHHLTKEDLADAGFYYAGYGDCARCFYCGGGLRNWEDEDDVWVEHARWFPKCAYIRQTMGQQFVNTVQDLNKDKDKISFQMVMDKMGSSAASFHLDTKNRPLIRDPAVMTVVNDCGYEQNDVIEAANYVKEKYGMLSADNIFLRLKHLKKCPDTSKATLSDESQASEKDTTILKKLKEENGQLRQQTACKICMDKDVAVVFLPCGHFVSCTDCAVAMKDCPVCRKQVRGIVRAFIG